MNNEFEDKPEESVTSTEIILFLRSDTTKFMY